MEQSNTFSRGNVVVEVVKSEMEQCRAVKFVINGKNTFPYSIGKTRDIEPDKAPPCGCGNRVFTINDTLGEHTLKKFGLTMDDYDDFKYCVETALTVGYCKRCKE